MTTVSIPILDLCFLTQPRNEEPASGETFNGCLTIQSVQQTNRYRVHDSHKREMKLSRNRNWRKTSTTTQVDSPVTNQQQQPMTFIAPTPTPYIAPAQQCSLDHLQPLSPSSPYCPSAQGSPGNTHSPLLHHQQYTSSSQLTPNAVYMTSAQMPVEYSSLSPAHTQSVQTFPHSPEQMLALSPGHLISKVPSPATSQYSTYMDVATPGEIPSYIPNHPPPRYEDSIANMNNTAMASMQHLLAAETALPNYHTTHPSTQY